MHRAVLELSDWVCQAIHSSKSLLSHTTLLKLPLAAAHSEVVQTHFDPNTVLLRGYVQVNLYILPTQRQEQVQLYAN